MNYNIFYYFFEYKIDVKTEFFYASKASGKVIFGVGVTFPNAPKASGKHLSSVVQKM